MNKARLQERYAAVLDAAERNDGSSAQHDWTEMDALMNAIFDAFKSAYEDPLP